jgi:hypothetical protein
MFEIAKAHINFVAKEMMPGYTVQVNENHNPQDDDKIKQVTMMMTQLLDMVLTCN